MNGPGQEARPWGHRLRISIYVTDQDLAQAADDPAISATQAAIKIFEENGLAVDFAGASWSEIQDQPSDQGSC